jgi:peptidoglycan/xylan/chitin deacetylase (PgdA/CDA1 family)
MWRILLIGAAVCILGTSLAWAQIERNTESRTKPDNTGDVSERDSLELPPELAPSLALQMSIAGRAAAISLAQDCQATALYLSEQYAGSEPALADTPPTDIAPAPVDASEPADAASAPEPDTQPASEAAEPTAMPEPAPDPVVAEPQAESQVPETPAVEAPAPATALDEPTAPEPAIEPPAGEVHIVDQPVADEPESDEPEADGPATDEPEPTETPTEAKETGVQSLDDLAAAQSRQDRSSEHQAHAELDLPPSTNTDIESAEKPSDAQSSDDESTLDATSASLLTGALDTENIEEKPNRRPDLSKHINKDRDADKEPAEPSADELLVDDHQTDSVDHPRRSVGGWRSVPPERETPPEDPKPAAPSRLILPPSNPPQEPVEPVETPEIVDEPVEDPELALSPDAAAMDATPAANPAPAPMNFDIPDGSRVLLDQLLTGQPEDRQISAVLETAPAPRRLVIAAVVDTSASGLDRLSHRAPIEPVLGNWPPSMPKHDVPVRIREVSRGNSRHKQVALTFDDGPHPEFTSQLLAVLDFYDVPATFFFVGVQALKYPHWVKMSHQAGHEIGSQTYDHFRLPKLPLEEKVYQIDEYQRLIEGLIGVTPRFLRPPGGQYDASIRELVTERGMVLGLWDVALNDTREGKTAAQMLQTARREIRPGSVVLAHDGIQTTVDMLPELIESLRAQGYEFVTMSELASGM